jgi:hypothetical protein
MSAITTRTFAEGTKKALVLGGEEFVRKMAFGSKWNWLRIAFSYALTPNGTSNITGTRFVVSLLNNTIQGRTYNSVNTTNCLGFLIHHTNESAGRTLTYTANSGSPYYTQAVDRGAYFTRVVNTTTKTVFSTSGGIPMIKTTAGAAVQRRGIALFDFLKPTSAGSGTANWQQRWACEMSAANNVPNDVTREVLQMGQFITGSATDPLTVTGSVLSWTDLVDAAANIDEAANGSLDTVSIFWNQSLYPMEIYDLMVFRIR